MENNGHPLRDGLSSQAMEAQQGQDPTGLDAKHDSAGRQALPETQEDQAND